MRIGLAMPTLSGAPVAIDVPAPGDHSLRAMALFSEGSGLISRELHLRDKSDPEHPKWLQGVTYQFIGLMISNGFDYLFEERIVNFGRKQNSGKQLNPFQKGLLATFAHDKGILTESQRHRLGIRLWYAYRHYVPHEFLAGFVTQVWSTGADQRAAAESIEPDFVSWVMMERAVDSAPERRGQYPAVVEQKVEQIRAVIPSLTALAGRKRTGD